MPDDPRTLIDEWVARPRNTARTVLVTIFGDTIRPVTSSVWLAQLFRLTEALGYNERLVRTSMTRLVTEGWLDNERIGRQSRYSLTESARGETLDAERRIYHRVRRGWPGRWAVAFVDSPHIDAETRDRISAHLTRHGFVALGRSVMGSPTATASDARDLCRAIAADALVPVGSFEFSDLDALVDTGFFHAAFGLEETASAYGDLIGFLRRIDTAISRADGSQAFALRTMLVHDLRRLRLRGTDLPDELMASTWPGTHAFELTAAMYPRLEAAGASWLREVLDLPRAPAPSERFDRAAPTRAC